MREIFDGFATALDQERREGVRKYTCHCRASRGKAKTFINILKSVSQEDVVKNAINKKFTLVIGSLSGAGA